MAKILVVDDTPNILKMVALTLKKAGHEVETVPDGEQALQRFAAGTDWDLLLVDHQMPGMTGAELVREVRHRDASARLVMMTAFGTLELASDVIKAGATDFLRKPFFTDQLRNAVNAALSRPRQTLPVSDGAQRISGPMPSITYAFNGFQYWAVGDEVSHGNVSPLPKALPAFPMQRTFQMSGPKGEKARCTVGITPHVAAQIHDAVSQVQPPEAFVWEVICRGALTNFLLEREQLPPDVLPVIELTSGQLKDARELCRVPRFRDWY